ncbi:MAG: isoprenylcysteine carboxylmethyltransferase family protein [Lachnospiraceae bacterium]|nr:isoprenylcysteine carboxylmethyltransferase family protein [Lachnospiraceae bacterium]
MIFQLAAMLILICFYAFYIAKILMQKKQSIQTNQMGKGNKPTKVLFIERIMSVATILTIVMEVFSIFLTKTYLPIGFRIAGIVTGICAVTIFAAATITMKTSWRVGIPEEKTELVTSGIYSISRNPAFVAFDLLYLAICLLFFYIPLLIISIWAAVMLHIQILQEEVHMHSMFGESYDEYKKHTGRYLGRK